MDPHLIFCLLGLRRFLDPGHRRHGDRADLEAARSGVLSAMRVRVAAAPCEGRDRSVGASKSICFGFDNK
jgi:hypothetical protein